MTGTGIIVGWVIAGILQWGVPAQPLPNSIVYADKKSCDDVASAYEDASMKRVSVRCIQVNVLQVK